MFYKVVFTTSVVCLLFFSFLTAKGQRLNLSASASAEDVNKKLDVAKASEPVEPKKVSLVRILEIEQRLQSEPDNWVLYNELGVLYAGRGSYPESVTALQRAAEIAPASATVYRNLGFVYDRMGKWDKATEAIQRSIAIDPDNLVSNSELCELWVLQPDYRQAASCYEHLMQLKPNDPVIYVRYSYSLANSDQLNKAESVSIEALKLFTDRPEIYNNAGIVRFMRKDYSGAAVYFKRSVALEPGYLPARFNLAVADYCSGKKGEAVDQYGVIKYGDPKLAEQLFAILFNDQVVHVKDGVSVVR